MDKDQLECRAKYCVTHHHACDCREAKFRRLLEAAREIKRTEKGISLMAWENAWAIFAEALKEWSAD